MRPDLSAVVARLTDPSLSRGERGRLLGRLLPLLLARARTAGAAAVAGGRWLTDVVLEVAPQVAVRDLAALRTDHDGRSGDDLADALIRSASLTSAGVGAAVGALAALPSTAVPALIVAPVTLSAETLAVVAVELKLVAELHAVYGVALPAAPAQRAVAVALAWARQRGVDLAALPGGLPTALGTAARRELRSRLVRRGRRNVASLAPVLAGSVAAAELNRRSTMTVGESVKADLRSRR